MDAAFDVVVPVCTVEGIDMVVLIGNDGSRLIELVGDGAPDNSDCAISCISWTQCGLGLPDTVIGVAIDIV